MPKQIKLNYRFHNPNTAETTVDVLFKMFLKANQKKVDQIIQSFSNQLSESQNPNTKPDVKAILTAKLLGS